MTEAEVNACSRLDLRLAMNFTHVVKYNRNIHVLCGLQHAELSFEPGERNDIAISISYSSLIGAYNTVMVLQM